MKPVLDPPLFSHPATSIPQLRPAQYILAKASARTGYSLLELLITLLLVAIIASFATPTLRTFVDSARADAFQESLRKAIYRTRSTAIFNKKIVSLCPYSEDGCGTNWEDGLMIFTDENNNGKIDTGDELLERFYIEKAGYSISWRASARKNFLRFSPSGMARAFGRFTICNSSNDLRLARTIVVNRQGRLRLYVDRNGDGIVEDIDGRMPHCPA
ncbi:MAG: GspH/FimT family protein [Pseudomonadales bacterium]